LIIFEGLRLKSIITTALAAAKNDALFKSGQKRLENYHLALLVFVKHYAAYDFAQIKPYNSFQTT